MAFLYEVSFRLSDDVRQQQPYLASDMDKLLARIKTILRRISGQPVVTSEGGLYTKVPKALNAKRDGLKSNFARIWDDVIILYEPSTYGASADLKDYYVMFGEFFSKPQPELILEKVLWHELLHIFINLPKQMHHGRIDRIIKYGLKLPGDPNPLGPVGFSC